MKPNSEQKEKFETIVFLKEAEHFPLPFFSAHFSLTKEGVIKNLRSTRGG